MDSIFKDLHILIIGDAMIDTYVKGSINRQSPEAPVPIVDIDETFHHLGGASNVALNIKSLGAKVSLIATIGNDIIGTLLKKELAKNNISDQYLITSNDRCTSQKTRVYNKSEYLLRFDNESISDINTIEEETAIAFFNEIISKNKINLVLFQDYNKGFLTKRLIETIISLCNEKNILSTVDPKKKNFFAYKNVTFFKPNLKEIKEALNREIDPCNIQSLEDAAKELQNMIRAKNIFITLSEHGVYLFNGHSFIQKAFERKVIDVSGAGDTVIAVVSLGLALKLSPNTILSLSNLAGGMVCEESGINALKWSDLKKEADKVGIFIV